MDLKEDIKSRLNIEEVIGRYVQLKKAGRNFKGLSPFTSEKTPSFIVSPEKQIWHDFSSNKGGDMFSFIMEVEGLDFKESLELLARQAGLNIGDYQQFRSSSKTDYKLKDRLLAANKSAQIFFQNNLKKFPESITYIKKRGISRQSVIDFGIGWAGGISGDELYKQLKLKGFSDDEIIKAGLANNRYGSISDVFRNRLVVSLTDLEGRVVGFTGRTLNSNNPKIPKYLNTSQTMIYDKGRQVFGLSLAKQFIKQKDAAILVEGNLDVVSLFQAGFQNVVATAGTAMTLYHLKQIKRFSSNIVLAYDSDAAGINATERAIILAEEAEMTIYIAELGDKFKDPDEMVQEDPKLFKQALANKVYGLDWLLKKYSQGLDLASAPDKARLVSSFSLVMLKLKDPVLKDHYIGQLAEMTSLSPNAIKLKFEQSGQGPVQHLKPVKKSALSDSARTLTQEIEITIDELITLAFKFKLKLKASEDLDLDSINEERKFLIKGDINVLIERGLSSDDSYAKIIALRSQEQFINWDKDQINDHQNYLQEKLKRLSLKNKIEQVSEKIKTNQYNNDQELRMLLEQQLSLTNKLRGEENG